MSDIDQHHAIMVELRAHTQLLGDLVKIALAAEQRALVAEQPPQRYTADERSRLDPDQAQFRPVMLSNVRAAALPAQLLFNEDAGQTYWAPAADVSELIGTGKWERAYRYKS